jgi:hypothetical protein
MNREDITRMAQDAGLIGHTPKPWGHRESVDRFAELVAEAERKVMQAKIETLYAMYELAVKQRDYLMEQQRAEIAAMYGKMQ